jgi:hypothetical protein
MKDGLCPVTRPAGRHVVTLMVLRHALLCRYTAGVYSHIPGAMAALPKFDEGSDFKIPANVVKGDSDIWKWKVCKVVCTCCSQVYECSYGGKVMHHK